MLKRRTIIQASLAGGLVAGLAGLSEIAHWYKEWWDVHGPGWKSMPWPFSVDAWPPGKAWRNRDLGLEVCVRLKLDFYGNCDTEVVADAEVDRVSDISLLDSDFVPVQAGNRIRITDLFGRARLYRVKTRDGERLAEAIAVSYKCDIVAAIVIGPIDDPQTRKAAHSFLETNTVQIWVNQILEGR
ncbi:MAG: hypothetical protein AB7F22_10085 [Reyranella sp.]|uniref:hypothetical protein n=1 Tax=Reyranella sp. TaxID=1929291 RepID=UPI003D14A084